MLQDSPRVFISLSPRCSCEVKGQNEFIWDSILYDIYSTEFLHYRQMRHCDLPYMIRKVRSIDLRLLKILHHRPAWSIFIFNVFWASLNSQDSVHGMLLRNCIAKSKKAILYQSKSQLDQYCQVWVTQSNTMTREQTGQSLRHDVWSI